MTYKKIEIGDIINNNVHEEERITVQGFPSSIVLAVLYEKQEISFILHEGKPDYHNLPTDGSMTYLLISFKPQENQLTQVAAVLERQE